MGRHKLLICSLLLLVNTVFTQTFCKNGGFLTDAGCNCPSFWSGNDCGTIQCINGGYTKDEKSCICPQGYLGVHCDAVTLIQAPVDQFDSNLPTFNLVYINLFSDYWGKAAKAQFEKFRYLEQNCDTKLNFITQHLGCQTKKNRIDCLNLTGKRICLYPSAVNNHMRTYNESYYQGGFNILFNTDYPRSKEVTQDETVYGFTTNSSISDVLGQKIMFPKYYACYQVPVIDDIVTKLIKANQLSQTAITVLTQHPITGDTASLVNLAQAFGIRINILWSDDQVFVRCGDSDIQGMKDLARQTGGLFISLKHDDTEPTQSITDALLMSHYAYQPTDFASGTGSLQMSFFAYPAPTQDYYLFTTGTLDTTAYPNAVPYGSVNMNAYLIPKLVQRNNLQINCAAAVDDCIGLVFTNDNTLYPLTVYSSFVEDVAVDTSNTQPDAGNPLHVALHVKNTGNAPISVSTASSFPDSQSNALPLTMVQRDRATFEFISNDTINCMMSTKEKAYKYWWTTVVLSVGSSKIQRVVRYNCKPISPNFATSTAVPNTASTSILSSTVVPSTASTSILSSTVVPSTVISTESSITLGDILSTVSSQVSTTQQTKPTEQPCTTTASFEPLQFISGFADTVNNSIFSVFNVQTYQSASSIYQKYGIIRFEVQNEQQNMKLSQVNSYDDYRTAAYDTMTWNSTIAGQPQDDSQVLDAIQTLASTSVSQNAFASFLVDKLPVTASFDITKYYPLVNRNIKLFMLMDISSFTREVSVFQRNSYPLNTIAALTSGHFIVSDQSDQTTFRALLKLVHDNTGKQNLLISRNFQIGQQNLGQLDLSQFSSETTLTLTITTEVTDNWDVNMFSPINANFNGVKAGNNKAVTFTRTASSNFYSASVTLSPDTYTIVARIQTTANVYLRIWSPRNVNMSEVQVGYADLKDDVLTTPDEDNGAALRTYMFNNAFTDNARIQIRDCTGNPIKLFDWDQSVISTTCSSDSSGMTTPAFYSSQLSWSAFVPFFCIANADPGLSTCQKETTNLYTVQVSGKTDAGAYMASKSFICNPAREANSINAYQDPNKNYLCGGTTVPYTRGPICHLRDCSGAGTLLYNSSLSSNADYAPYQCVCKDATGESCEIGVCPVKNQDAGTSDSVYRTLTVVVGAYGVTSSYTLQNALVAIGPFNNTDNIWQYQLLLQCSTGDVYTLYIGSSVDSFNDKFNQNTIRCSASNSNSSSLNIQTMFDYATVAVGRSQKGMIVFYTENPELITVNKTEIVRYTQQYRQEIHMLTVLDPDLVQSYGDPQFPQGMEDMISVAFSTGGTFIVGELSTDDFLPKPIPLYGYILGSSVSYNFMDPNNKNTPFSFYVEASAESAYLLVGGHRTLLIQGTPNNTINCLVTGSVNQLCILKSGISYTITPNGLNLPVWATVIVANGITPMTAIIQQRNADDRQTAFAVDYIDAGPIIGYQLPSGMEIISSSDDKLRISSRTHCTYDTTSYSISDPVTPIMKLLQIGIQDANNPTSPKVTKYLPITVSSAVVCRNGGTARNDIGACNCPSGFTGADCGQVTCDDGLISTWGSACNCRDQLKFGRNCDQAKPSSASFFASW